MARVRTPLTVVDAVTSTGAGSGVDLGESLDTFSYVLWSTSGGAGSSDVKLEGSHDGSHWFTLADPSVAGSALTSGRVNETVHARYVRGNVIGLISGGAAVTMTVVPA
jgi:cyanophycinase-like exopeptidase